MLYVYYNAWVVDGPIANPLPIYERALTYILKWMEFESTPQYPRCRRQYALQRI